MTTRLTAFAFVCVLVSSCSHTVIVEAPTVTPVVEAVNIKVAVIYNEALRNFHCTASQGYIAEEWPIKLGPASMVTFTTIFSSMFEDVVFLPTGAEAPVGDDTYVIRLSLESYTGCDVSWPIIGSPVAVTYSAEVLRGPDKVMEAWTGYGEGTAEEIVARHGSTINIEDYLASITTLAIRRAAADFLWKFEEDERVLAWKSAATSDASYD